MERQALRLSTGQVRYAIPYDILGHLSPTGCRETEQVSVPQAAPLVDRVEVETVGVWVRSREASGVEPFAHLLEFRERQPEAARCDVCRDITGLDMKSHRLHSRLR